MHRPLLLFTYFLIGFRSLCFPQTDGNQALVLNGSNQYVRIPDTVYHPSSGTIELWTKRTGEGSGKNPLFGGIGVVSGRMPGIFVSNGDVFWEFGEVAEQSSGYHLIEDQWTHLAMTYQEMGNGFQLMLWINGELYAKQNGVSPPPSWNAEVHIGHYLGGPVDYYEGEIDELRIWNEVRSSEQIRQFMCQSVSVKDSSLILYVPFDETSGNFAEEVTQRHVVELKYISENEFVTSEAAIGDTSIYLYPLNSDWTNRTLLFHADQGEIVELSKVSGTHTGLHLVRTEELDSTTSLPNGYIDTLASGIYQVFPVGGKTSNFQIEMRKAVSLINPIDRRLRMVQMSEKEEDWKHTGAYLHLKSQNLTYVDGKDRVAYAMALREHATTTQPGSGSALRFDGVNDQVLSTYSMSSHAIQGLTFECWFQVANLGRRQVLMEIGANGSLRIGISEDSSLFVLHNGAISNGLGKIHAGVWYHLSYVHDVGTDDGFVYINGEQVGTSTVPIGELAEGALHLGASSMESGTHFLGYLDEIRLWDGYISPNTLRSWMLRRLSPDHPNYDQLQIHYSFDEDVSDSHMLENKAGVWDAVMIGMNPLQQRGISSVPMGDVVSILDLEDIHAPILQLGHTDGDRLTLKDFHGNSLPRYMYLYRVDEAAVVEDAFFLAQWSDLRYWGVFMGEQGKDMEYTIEFEYRGYPEIASEAGLTLANRDLPGGPVWYNTFSTLDMGTGLIHLESSGNQEWVLGEGFPFQIAWEEVKARWEKQDVMVEWKVGQEDGLSHYEVERSIDGRLFSRISTVLYDPSNSGSYQYLDLTASSQEDQHWFFRIKQVDVQGGFSYSEVVKVQGTYTVSGLQTSPNPCTSTLTLELPGGRTQAGVVCLLNIQGKILHKRHISAEQEQVVIDMEQIQSGLYLVQVYADQQVWGQKVWKN